MATIETPAEILSNAAGQDAAEDFVKWRKKLRKPLTERAAKMIAKTLSAINAAGGDATKPLPAQNADDAALAEHIACLSCAVQ